MHSLAPTQTSAKRILCVGAIIAGEMDLRVKPITDNEQFMLAAFAYGRNLFQTGASRDACANAYEIAGFDEAAAEVEATIDEVMGKPRLEASSIDYDGELDDLIEGRDDDEWHSRGMW